MSTIMMLGPIQFRLVGLNPQKISYQRDVPFAKHKVIGAEPVKEFLGPDEEVVEIKGCFFPFSPTGAGGLSGVSALKVAREMAIPLPLVRADGGASGWYLIEDIKVEHEMLAQNGTGREVNFTVKLISAGRPGVGLVGAILGLFRL